LPMIQSVARAANRLFVTSGKDLWLLQLQPLTVTGIKVWSSSLNIGDLSSSGNLLYVVKSDDMASPGFLEILNMETPGTPVVLGEVQLSIQGGSRIIVAEDYAYVGSWNGISAINIANPTTLTETHYVLTSGNVGGLQVQGQYLYAATTDGLLIYDISDPAMLILVGEYPGVFARDLGVAGNYAFVAASSGPGLRIIDVSSPTSPALVRTINTCGSLNAISVSQGFAYILDGCRQVDMYDVSDPVGGSSFPAGSASLPGYGNQIVIEGRDLYVTASEGGFVKLERLEYVDEIIPPEGSSLTSPDGTTTVTIPAGAFTESILLRYYEEAALPTGNLSSAGAFFSLATFETVNWQSTPLLPDGTITITIQYELPALRSDPILMGSQPYANNEFVIPESIIEDAVQLYRWKNGEWVTDGIVSNVDTEAKQVTAIIDSFSGEETFALLGESYQVYLPVMLR